MDDNLILLVRLSNVALIFQLFIIYYSSKTRANLIRIELELKENKELVRAIYEENKKKGRFKNE